jgi:PHD/YefM family antitoxin component YafN of YafNO toxin-antitoxin module
MSLRATVRQMKERFEDYLVKAVEERQPCIVERGGKSYAVLVSHEEWERREIGRRLDALGEEYRVAPEFQRRAEELLGEQSRRKLTDSERRELRTLRKEFDRIMLRRSKALEQLR